MAGSKRSGGGAAVMDPPDDVASLRSADGLKQAAASNVEYWTDDTGKLMGADVSCWKIDGTIVSQWQARIRWKPDLESGGTGGRFMMTYPNPGGGADYVVEGRQQLQPLVDQAVSIGSKAVFGDAFVT